MAFERISERKQSAGNLGTTIANSLILLQNQAATRNLEDESEFTTQVLQDNLTLDDQLAYRKEQHKRVPARDKEERARVKGEISKLTNLIKVKDFEDAYLIELTEINEGTQSLETTIKWLNDRLTKTTDPNIQTNIKENLSEMKKLRYTQQQNALQAQTTFAIADKRMDILDNQIDSVSNMRSKAVRAGNEDYVGLLDLQLQSLNKTKTETQINNTITNISVNSITGQSALGLLNEMNTQIDSSDDGVPINIGGVSYESARDFWDTKRSEFLNDSSQNGFFDRYKQELTDKTAYKVSVGTFNNNSMGEVNNWWESIKGRPELSEYQEKLSQTQQSSLQESADARAVSITNKYAVDLDAKAAISSFAELQDKYGVDQTTNYQNILLKSAATKETAIKQILDTMNQIALDNPGISQQDAMNQAISSGAGAIITPESEATESATDIISGLGEKAEEQAFGQQDIFSAPKDSTFTTPDMQEGALVKTADSPTVFKFEGGKLREFIGNFDDDLFKQASGKNFASVQTVKSLGTAPKGEAIKATDFVTQPAGATSAFEEGNFYKKTGSKTVYKLENNRLRPFVGNWDENSFRQFTGKGFGDVKTVDKFGDLGLGQRIKRDNQ